MIRMGAEQGSAEDAAALNGSRPTLAPAFRTDTIETTLSTDTSKWLYDRTNSSGSISSLNGETVTVVDLTSELDKDSNCSANGVVLRKRLSDLSQAFLFPLFIMQTFGLIVGPCVPPADFDSRLIFSYLRVDDPDVEKKLCPEKQARLAAEAAAETAGELLRRNSMLIRRSRCVIRQKIATVLNPGGILLMATAFGYSIWGLCKAARDPCVAERVGVVFAIINVMWIGEQLAVALLLRRAWNGPLKDIVWKWRTTKCLCILKKQVNSINRVSIVTFTIGLLLVAVNILIMGPLVFEVMPETSKLFTYVLPRFDNATTPCANIAVRCGFMLCVGLLTAYSYLVPCLIILIAYVMCEEFERINQLLQVEYDRERRTLNVELALLRTWHQNICFLVDKCDEAFRMIIAVLAAVDIFNTVFVLYQICDSYNNASDSVLWTYFFWLVGHVTKWLIVSLMCARVHEVAHRPLAVLFNIDAKTYSPNVDDHNARLELLLFTGKLASSLRIGITAGGVVTLTRSTILSLFTFLLTLVLVMLQMKQKVL